MATTDLIQLSTKTNRVERHWIDHGKRDLDVYRIPIDPLYFNIENGRYADRMIRLKSEYKGQEIDPRKDRWKIEIEKMLAGEHRDTQKDKAAFERLIEDLRSREQLRPGVVLADGGVIDGNRRLAALRRLRAQSTNTAQFSTFDAVILPADTTEEDRWRIEAGIQLSINERWDYSPVNELLKVRAGLQLYQEMIGRGQFPGETATALVAKAIYGKEESAITEMAQRLQLIDEYLEFIEKPKQYDLIGSVSERFLEARRIVTAAENHQRDLGFLAKLKAVLFYQIHLEKMDNWQLRLIYDALGGDPTKRGRKPTANEKAIKEFMESFPEPREIQRALTAGTDPVAQAPEPPKSTRRADAAKKGSGSEQSKPPVDVAKTEASTERFVRTIEAAGREMPLRKIAEGARADVQALESGLQDKKRREGLEFDDRTAVRKGVDSMLGSLRNCEKLLKKSP